MFAPRKRRKGGKRPDSALQSSRRVSRVDGTMPGQTMGNGRWTRERRETEYHRLSRLQAERKLAAIERRRAVRESRKSVRVMKDEVAKQIAQIVEDRAFATRPTYQIPPSWKATHITRPQAFYKVVACRDDKFVSVVDGDTEFALGKTYKTRRGTPSGWAPMSECFLAWNSPLGALNAAFPEGSKATGLPRVLLKIEGRGNAYEEHEVFRGGHSRWTGQISLGAIKVCRIMTDAFRNTSADKVLLPDFHIPQKFPPLMPSWDL